MKVYMKCPRCLTDLEITCSDERIEILEVDLKDSEVEQNEEEFDLGIDFID